MLHYLKREYETMYVHRFSAASMPLRNVPKNCSHYWLLGGLALAYFSYGPVMPYISYASVSNPILNPVGVALWIYAQSSNLGTHQRLAALRSPGGTERGIPQGYGFAWCTCPNYFFEILAWFGVLLITRSLATAAFLAVGGTQMYFWAVKKEKNYRKEFGDRYKKKRAVLIPKLL